jgi:inward rectifier potassium channel
MARLISPEGRSTLVQSGLQRKPFGDLYHLWLLASWPRAFGAVIAIYLAANVVFALGYFVVGGIENARPGSFSDAFFFSVQTIATIGYGRMSPVSAGAHVLVTVESFCGLIGMALITGLMFAKFARPTSRVLWSEVAVVALQDGAPSFMFRVANARGNQIVEAQLRVGMLVFETTPEGERVRRMHDLPLVRSSSMVFALSWMAIHPIAPGSKLYGATAESLRAANAEIYCSLTGLDGTSSQTIHARHSYSVDEIQWGRRYVDIMGPLPDGRMGIDYTRFHETKPAPLG